MANQGETTWSLVKNNSQEKTPPKFSRQKSPNNFLSIPPKRDSI
jgi:hypothetical protein